MDKALFDRIFARVPRPTKAIARGLVTTESEQIMHQTEQMFKETTLGFPPGWEYMGCTRVTPLEEYRFVSSKSQKTEPTYENAQSYVYLVAYRFAYQGVLQDPVYQYLPFFDVGNRIKLKGANYLVAPVLADNVLLVVGKPNEGSSLVLKLSMSSSPIQRLTHRYMTDGIPATSDVVYGVLHHGLEKTRRNYMPDVIQRRGVVGLATYLLAVWGFHGLFKQVMGCDIVAINPSEYSPEKYPTDQWVVCHSTMLRPKTLITQNFVAPNVWFLVPRQQFTRTIEFLLVSMIYTLDHFGDVFDVGSLAQNPILDEQGRPDPTQDTLLAFELQQWRDYMGDLMYPPDETVVTKRKNVEEHLNSLASNINVFTQAQLKEDGIDVDNFWELMLYLIENFPRLIAVRSNSATSMYHKRIHAMRFLLQQRRISSNRLMYTMRNESKKENGSKVFQQKDIRKNFNTYLRYNDILSLPSTSGMVRSLESASSCYYFKMSSALVHQDAVNNRKTQGKKSGASFTISGAMRLDASIAEVGSYNVWSKKNPDGRSRLNLYVQLDQIGQILRNPEFIPLLSKTQASFG